ncbi:hypothetical protein [Namhaeicola litoreus]|uniref:Outer membrane protein beta-barrel domain-containing protein n=1 Tax=Namhaeicola litoreus TaxID=1052145 RepID=A0ABW3Y1U6_9FLAO
MKEKFYLLSFFVLFSFFAQAQDEVGYAESEFTESSARRDWRFKLAPYAWLAGQATDVNDERLRQSFNDLTSLTNFGMQLAGKIYYKKWFVSSNLTYAKLGDDGQESFVQYDLGINQIILDNKIGYVLIDHLDYDNNDIIDGWAMEVTLGAIYWLNDINFKYTIPIGDILPPITGNLSETQKWWDPVVGTSFRLILSKSVLMSLQTNIGGFGLGNASDFYYDLSYLNTFKVSKLLTVTAGYKTFQYKRIEGSGEERIKTNVTTFGPLLGVTMNF